MNLPKNYSYKDTDREDIKVIRDDGNGLNICYVTKRLAEKKNAYIKISPTGSWISGRDLGSVVFDELSTEAATKISLDRSISKIYCINANKNNPLIIKCDNVEVKGIKSDGHFKIKTELAHKEVSLKSLELKNVDFESFSFRRARTFANISIKNLKGGSTLSISGEGVDSEFNSLYIDNVVSNVTLCAIYTDDKSESGKKDYIIENSECVNPNNPNSVTSLSLCARNGIEIKNIRFLYEGVSHALISSNDKINIDLTEKLRKDDIAVINLGNKNSSINFGNFEAKLPPSIIHPETHSLKGEINLSDVDVKIDLSGYKIEFPTMNIDDFTATLLDGKEPAKLRCFDSVNLVRSRIILHSGQEITTDKPFRLKFDTELDMTNSNIKRFCGKTEIASTKVSKLNVKDSDGLGGDLYVTGIKGSPDASINALTIGKNTDLSIKLNTIKSEGIGYNQQSSKISMTNVEADGESVEITLLADNEPGGKELIEVKNCSFEGRVDFLLRTKDLSKIEDSVFKDGKIELYHVKEVRDSEIGDSSISNVENIDYSEIKSCVYKDIKTISYQYGYNEEKSNLEMLGGDTPSFKGSFRAVDVNLNESKRKITEVEL